MRTLDDMRVVRKALQDAGLDTPFTSRIKRGFSIKLCFGSEDSPSNNTAYDELKADATAALKGFDGIEVRKTRAREHRCGTMNINVVVRIT